jgi:hypothetical protein
MCLGNGDTDLGAVWNFEDSQMGAVWCSSDSMDKSTSMTTFGHQIPGIPSSTIKYKNREMCASFKKSVCRML